MAKYIPTIGLEIHAELKTKSKMFCGCKNNPEEKSPNINICPVCMGNPGTLPVINKEAVRKVISVGYAVGGKIADFTEWDRKNYFYPDIPKGYQISQYKYPLVEGGEINGFKIKRIHLEEDTARSAHDRGDYSLVDYNRAGLPLMELVTEAVIHDAKQASDFAKELQLVLWYLDASDANMEKGEMRVEANISIAKEGSTELGTKVEVKNLNSFKAVEKSIAFEIERQAALLERGEKVIQETRGYDENTDKTFSQRVKETSDDYRYFPDPDLPKLFTSKIPEFAESEIRKNLPELPWEKREKYSALGLQKDQTDYLVNNPKFGFWFDDTKKLVEEIENGTKLLANYATSDLVYLLKDKESNVPQISGQNFAELIGMVSRGEISSRGAKDILAKMVLKDESPKVIAEREGLLQSNDEGAMKAIVEKVIGANEKVVADYRGGKAASLQFLLGQVMKESKGSANPSVAKDILLKLLG